MNEIEFISKVYSISELSPNGKGAIKFILGSFDSAFWDGEQKHLDLGQVLKQIDISKISGSEMIALLTMTIECNNPSIYVTDDRKGFYKRVEDYFIAQKGNKYAKTALQGLE